MSATEGCDEESRQHRVTGHSPNPGAAAGRKGFRPRRVTLVELSTIESETWQRRQLAGRTSRLANSVSQLVSEIPFLRRFLSAQLPCSITLLDRATTEVAK